jgi:hypothetical protein
MWYSKYLKIIQVTYLRYHIINLILVFLYMILAYLVDHIKYFLYIYELHSFVSLKQNIMNYKRFTWYYKKHY